MTDFDFDRELTHALRGATEQASPGFTGRVLDGLERPPHRPERRRAPLARPLLAVAALALVLAAIPAVRRAVAPEPSRQTAARSVEEAKREALLREYRALAEELATIRRIADEQQPVLYLGGDEDFDVLYDLAAYTSDERSGGARPAAIRDRG
jgi:hypothetical protein